MRVTGTAECARSRFASRLIRAAMTAFAATPVTCDRASLREDENAGLPQRLRRQNELRPEQQDPSIPTLFAAKPVRLARPKDEHRARLTPDRFEIDQLRAFAARNAKKHPERVAVGQLQLFAESPAQIRHGEDLEV
jgi:hypothetical protein